MAGELSVALADAGAAVPLAQDRLTVTLAALLSEKSLLTMKVFWLSVFTIVQVPTDRGAEHDPVEL